MSSYLKHVSSTEGMFVGERFPAMLEAAQTEARLPEWEHYGTARGVLKARTFSHACRTMGVNLIYEGNDRFTVELDGTYESSLLIPLAERVAPFANDGKIFAMRKNGQLIAAIFQEGKVKVYETEVEVEEE